MLICVLQVMVMFMSCGDSTQSHRHLTSKLFDESGMEVPGIVMMMLQAEIFIVGMEQLHAIVETIFT